MKTILITGSTDGIGRQTALELARSGHRIILHGRNRVRGLLVREDIIKTTGNSNIDYLNADFTDFEQIRSLAEQVKAELSKLDVLLNNAGVMMDDRVILPNGLETTFMVNHIAPFMLTLLLLDLIGKSDDPRIVNVSSQAQAGTIDFDNLNGEKYYDRFNAYALSKLENVLFTYRLARELEGSKITANALHPGVISTKLLHQNWGGGGAPLETGAKTTVYACVAEELKGKSGLYFVDARVRKSSAISYDARIQDRLWKISLDYSGLADPF